MTTDEGGEAACWLHLVCDDCGAVVADGADHGCAGPGDRAGGDGGSRRRDGANQGDGRDPTHPASSEPRSAGGA